MALFGEFKAASTAGNFVTGYSAGFVVDGHGNYGIILAEISGVAIGLSGTVGFGLQVNWSADTISDLNGVSTQYGGCAARGVGACISANRESLSISPELGYGAQVSAIDVEMHVIELGTIDVPDVLHTGVTVLKGIVTEFGESLVPDENVCKGYFCSSGYSLVFWQQA